MVVAKDNDCGKPGWTIRLIYAKQLLPALGDTVKDIATEYFWHHFKFRLENLLTVEDRDDPTMRAMLQEAASPGVCHLSVKFLMSR